MKEIKKNIDAETWAQLTDKIKDADESKKRDLLEFMDKVQTILGDLDIKITIPKNFKESHLLKEDTI